MPLPTVASLPARANAAVRNGPTHGVQPKAKAPPMTGGAKLPNFDGRTSIRRSLISGSMNRGFQTAVTAMNSPMMMTSQPAIDRNKLVSESSHCDNDVAKAPRATKTAVKPATNPRVPMTTRRVDASPLDNSDSEYPDIKDR